jgi:hypothetical protein
MDSRVSRISAAIAGLFVLLPVLGCPNKDKGVPDAAPAVVAPVATPEPTQELKLAEPEDAGIVDAAPDVKKPTGPGVPANVARLRQCCGALSAQARTLGASPEAGFLLGAANTCNMLAGQAGSGNAPELAPLKNLLRGKTIPPVCQGL